MNDFKRSQIDIAIFIGGVVGIIIVDRLSKIFFCHLLDLNESLVLIRNILHFTLIHNTGIAFGLFKDSDFVYFMIPLVLIGLLIYNIYYYRYAQQLSRVYIIAFSLILGGAIGNLIDRVCFGYVIDFIDLRVWPVFNIADSAITIGAAIIFLKCIRQQDNKVRGLKH